MGSRPPIHLGSGEPTHKLTELDGVGHIPMFEAPGRITRVITDFIEECRRAPGREKSTAS